MVSQLTSRNAVILTALNVEYQSVRAHLKNIHEKVHSTGTIYEVGIFEGEKGAWSIAIAQIGAGNPGAALQAERAISFFQPDIVLFVGVAGGIKDVTIGDVVVADKIYGYESGKWDQTDFFSRPSVGLTSYRILERAKFESRLEDWKAFVTQDENIEAKVFVGAIAAGEKVIASTQNEVFQLIRTHYNDALAIEMEGRGFLMATHAHDNIPAVVVRGISDLLENKAQSDRQGSQIKASKYASAFTFRLLSQIDILPRTPSQQSVDESPISLWDVLRPLYPRLFIGRDQDIADIKKRLGLDPNTPRQNLTVIRGWPGVGKTTFINKLLHDADLKNAFNDGILWASVGPQEPNDAPEYSSAAIVELRRWAREIGIFNFDNLSTEQLAAQVQARIRNKNVLLVVDDIWRDSDGQLFRNVADQIPLIITTRFSDLAESMADFPQNDIYFLRVLEQEESLELIRSIAPKASSKYSNKLPALVDSLEGLPLALRVAGSLIEKEVTIFADVTALIDELIESHRLIKEKAPSNRMEKDGTTPTILLLLKRSVDTLDNANQEKFAILGAFRAKPATFDLEAIKYMWKVEDPFPIVSVLVGRGLLEPIVEERRFQMHATLKMYAESILEDDEGGDTQ